MLQETAAGGLGMVETPSAALSRATCWQDDIKDTAVRPTPPTCTSFGDERGS
ncbi:MAG TPA: hypothetical protein V6D04_00585 [Candidatus Obscuribacterales bacterium]